MGTVSRLPSGGPAAVFADGYANLMSRLGSTADRSASAYYWVPPLSQQQIEAAYRTSWLTRKVHDLPAFEMTRAGRDWEADQKQITLLEATETRLNLWGKLRTALATAKLHGGAALILGVRQGLPSSPLVVERLGKDTLRYALVVSRHQLRAPQGMDYDAESDFFMQPAMYELNGAKGNAVPIHPSRVIPFHGLPIPTGAITVSAIDQFWGDPLLQSIKGAVDNAEASQAAVASLLHVMKQDVISIPGLTEQIATAGSEGALSARIEAINTLRSMFNALLLDGGDDEGKGGEKWETRELSFAQMPELLQQFIGVVAGATDIPVTRLLGQSPGGLQSTGKGEQDDFNRMIESQQAAYLAPVLARLDEILIRSSLGTRPDEISYLFAPLEEPDEAAQAAVEKLEAETVQIYQSTALIPNDALAKATVNRLVENGRWPGLQQGIDDSAEELGALPEPAPVDPNAANDNAAQADQMEQRRTITRDQALVLLADARPRTLYVSRKLENADEFLRWAKSQGFGDTLAADDLHVTVVYSETPVDWFSVGDDNWGDDGKLTVSPGGPRAVEQFDGGAVVLQFASSRLGWRHEELKRGGATSKRPEFAPHITITYAKPDGLDVAAVQPYRGKLVFGPEIFQEIDRQRES